MIISGILFYLFAICTCICACAVVTLRNPVHAVLFLVLTFLITSALCILIGAEFIAMSLIIVYVGAVAILFLFVVMMIDLKEVSKKSCSYTKILAGLLIGGLLLFNLMSLFYRDFYQNHIYTNIDKQVYVASPTPPPEFMHNTKALGMILYTDYMVAFQCAGIILLIAMIGSIILTLRTRTGTLRQDIGKQLARTRSESVKIVKVETGKGI